MKFLLDIGSFLIVSKPTNKGTQFSNAVIQPPPPDPRPQRGRGRHGGRLRRPPSFPRPRAGRPRESHHLTITYSLFLSYMHNTFQKKPLTIKIVYYFTIYRQIILKKISNTEKLLFLLKIKIFLSAISSIVL